MIITTEHADVLIRHLRKGSVSIPDLQLELKLKYREASCLIAYGIKQGWVYDKCVGNRFPATEKNYEPLELPPAMCESCMDSLDEHEIDALVCFHGKNPLQIEDILQKVTKSKSDAREIMSTLIEQALVFELDGYYYCTVAPKSLEIIKKLKEKQDADAAEQRRKRFMSRRIFDD